MTVDVRFGKLVDTEDGQWVEWPGKDQGDKEKEDDGTNPQYTIYSGKPYRSFSYSGYGDFLRRVPIAETINSLCKPLYPRTSDTEWRHIDQTLLDLIDQLPETDGDIDTDRARWYKYWSRRAFEEFGQDAAILIY